MAFPRLLLPSIDPIELEVVLYVVLGGKTSEQVSETLIIGKIIKVETPGILVKDVEFFGETDGKDLLGLEFLVADNVPCLCDCFSA